MESMVGFRFHPTDDELVDHFLKLKRLGEDYRVRAIAEVDIYKWEPSELPGLSAIKSDDQEWFFFCPRELKYSSSQRTNRATKSGYWKSTGRDRNIKAKRSNKVIGKKKTLVFHTGRVPYGVGTDWVIHEYYSTSTLLPHQKDFVLCRLMKKHDVSICDEVEASSYPASDFESQAPDDSISEVYIQPEADLESFFQTAFQDEDFDFASTLQTVSNTQGSPFIDPVFPNSCNNELNWMQFLSDRDEQEEDTEFLTTLIVDQDENSQEEIRHFRDIREPESLQKVYLYTGGSSSDTDTDNAQAPCDRLMGTSSLFNEQVSPQEALQMQILKLQSGTVSSSSANHDQYRSRGSSFHHDDLVTILRPSINRISRVRAKSPAKVRTSTPPHQHRLCQSAGQRVARRVQLQNNNSQRIVSHDKAKDALGDSITTSLPQKETSIMDSDKEQKMAQCTNTKKSFKSTTLDSAGSDRKGYFIFVEASQQSHVSSPPLVYLAKLLFGLFLFLVFIREVVVYGM